ncbi:hypothetical protein MNBD_GAMMA12-659 [hydrothermal vent metagenome]|uniref:Transcriptional coactivator p15 (PC4) C-terminal domain-containing protein n=1 Tax=hydrothermal vent metagenome TaxID=652676 RepID=A0A3B0YGR1_9ZZZZ
MAAATVDELTIEYTENEVLLRKELDKQVLSKGAWSTIIYRYQDWNKTKEEFGPDKYQVTRYQKSDGNYKQRSKFNISSKAQAEGLIEALQKWISEESVDE